jgi:hypothetical protein
MDFGTKILDETKEAIHKKKVLDHYRGMIPITVIDEHLARVINKLFVESYWNMADNRASVWMKKRQQEYADINKSPAM